MSGYTFARTDSKRKSSVSVLISIDTGSGSTKRMERFLREGRGKKTRDVLVIAEAQAEKESAESVLQCLHPSLIPSNTWKKKEYSLRTKNVGYITA